MEKQRVPKSPKSNKYSQFTLKKKIAILNGVISLFVLCWLFLSQMYKVYFTNNIVYQGTSIKRQLTIEFIMICWYNSLYRLKLKQSIGYKSVNIASTMML